MGRWLARMIVVGLVAALAACGPSKFKTYNGPPVTQVVVSKHDRKMYLLSGNRALKV